MSEYILETNGLSKSFSRKKAVDNIDLKIRKGDIYGFIGKNGAGKTTAIKLISGLIKSDEGIIRLFDSDNLAEGRKKIGVVIENPAYYPYMSAYQNIEVQRKMKGVKDPQVTNHLLEVVGLSDTKNKKVKNFSLGMKQRLGIEPEFLILDEPINGLDPMGIKEIRNLILKLKEESGISVLISSHILGELSKMCTAYGVITQGKLTTQIRQEELKELVKPFINVEVDNLEEAKKVIELGFEGARIEIEGNNLHIYEISDKFMEINTVLIQNNISVRSISKQDGNYEDYFISLMEGEQK